MSGVQLPNKIRTAVFLRNGKRYASITDYVALRLAGMEKAK